MSFADWTRTVPESSTAATPATPATDRDRNSETVATVATVADTRKAQKDASPHHDPRAEARRRRVLAMLAANPVLRIAVVCDGEGDPVPVAVGIRDKGTCEVYIPREKYDPFLLLELIERHGGTIH